jgi:hypothetical protein
VIAIHPVWRCIAFLLLAGCAVVRPADIAARPGCTLDVATHVASCPCAVQADVAEIPDRTDLEMLRLHAAEHLDLSPLARLTHLRALSIDGDADVATLAKVERVRQLDLSAMSLRDLAPVGRITRLERLAIRCEAGCDLGALAPLEDLRALTLLGPRLDLAPLASLHLTSLELGAAYDATTTLEGAVVTVRAKGPCDGDPRACARKDAACR